MIVTDIPIYDGSLIHNRFAYKFHRKKVLSIGNIVAFRAPMKVETSGMMRHSDSSRPGKATRSYPRTGFSAEA